MSDTIPESERKLRAVMRALLSTGVWGLILLYAVGVFPVRFGLFDAGQQGGMQWLSAFWGGFLFAAILFFTAGLYTALARSRETVSARQVFESAVPVFPRFLLLFLKLAGLAALGVATLTLLLTLVLMTMGYGEVEVKAMHPGFEKSFNILALLIRAALVWWLPWVFVHQEFRLFPGLRSALRQITQEPGRTAYVLSLVLIPSMVLMQVAGHVEPWLLTPIEILGLLCVWSANIYCVEWLRDTTAEASAVPGT